MRKFVVAVALLLCASAGAAAQEGNGSDRLDVFLDCNTGGCDFDHFRQEIAWVNWVRDRTDADVHLLITGQGTGAGGRLFELSYIGRARFQGENARLTVSTAATDTQDERREALTRTIKLGLARYAAGTDLASRLDISFAAPAGLASSPASGARAVDPWNAWVFNLSVSGSADGESLSRAYSVRGTARASRVTRVHKTQLRISGDYRDSEFKYISTSDTEPDAQDTTVFSDIRRNYSASAYQVWSLSPHWSAGVQAEGSTSTRQNQQISFGAGPALEFSVFPYAEHTRRQLTAVYSVQANYFEYEELTIYGQLEETVFDHSLRISYRATQPWGNAYISLNGHQYFHDLARYSVSIWAGTNLRVFRGLNLDVNGFAARVSDQLYVPRYQGSLDDVLLQRRQLETSFRYRINVGLSYRFGSIFNNVVNPRLDNI